MRTAIDKYKDACDAQKITSTKIDSYCYPDSLDMLVQGVKLANDPKAPRSAFCAASPRPRSPRPPIGA